MDLRTKKWCESAFNEHYTELAEMFILKYDNLSKDEVLDVIDKVFGGILDISFSVLWKVEKPICWLHTRINQRILNYLRDVGKEPTLSLEEIRSEIESIEIKDKEEYTIDDIIKLIDIIVPLSNVEKKLLLDKQTMKAKEIANELGWSVSNVNTKYKRTLGRIKRGLTPVCQNEYFFLKILDSNIDRI